jgi:hypothetical protein
MTSSSQAAARHNEQGTKALMRGDGAAAVAAFAAATRTDPDSAILWYNLANAHAISGDPAAQLAALDEALARDPFMPHALLAKGRLLEAEGQAREALETYQRLIAAVPPDAQHGPGFNAGLAHARRVVKEANDTLLARIDAALGPQLASADPDEASRFRLAVDVALGRRRVYQPQPLVLHYPWLPPIQYFPRAHFPWLAELEAATPIIRAELEGLLADGNNAGFAPYVAYPKGMPVNQWGALNHNDAWGARFFTQHGRPDAETRARCPQTAALLDRLPLFDLEGRGPVSFFSLLKPHTHIPPHTGATNIRTIIHLPLIVPEGCWFRVGNETRPWVEGQAFAFDDTIEHEAMNPTDRLRAVLIIDTWNPHLSETERGLLRTYMAALETEKRALATFSAA